MRLSTTKYYIEYFAVYSVFMKLGIKCEIHDCTMSLTRFLETENIIKPGISRILEKDKELRIDNQYYLKNKPVDINFEKLSSFLLSTKEALKKLNTSKTKDIRKKIEKL